MGSLNIFIIEHFDNEIFNCQLFAHCENKFKLFVNEIFYSQMYKKNKL